MHLYHDTRFSLSLGQLKISLTYQVLKIMFTRCNQLEEIKTSFASEYLLLIVFRSLSSAFSELLSIGITITQFPINVVTIS